MRPTPAEWRAYVRACVAKRLRSDRILLRDVERQIAAQELQDAPRPAEAPHEPKIAPTPSSEPLRASERIALAFGRRPSLDHGWRKV